MAKTIKHALTWTLLAASIVGCSSNTIKVEKVKPNPLPKLETATASLAEVQRFSVASLPAAERGHIRIDTDGQALYTADPNGEVTAYVKGKRLWQVRPTKQLTAGVSVGDQLAVVANGKGEIFALDRQTGKLAWQQNVTGAVLAPSLIHANRVVSISNDGTVYAHNAANGQVFWTYKLPNVQLSLRGQAAPVLLDDRTVLVATANAYVYAIDIITGAPRWQRRVAVSEGRSDIQRLIDIDGQPVVYDRYMVTASYQGQVTAIDLSNQRVIWSNDASSIHQPLVTEQQVIVSQTNGKITAYSLSNGQQVWELDSLLNRKLSNPVLLGQRIVVGDLDGVLHIVDPATGQLIGRSKTRGEVSHLRVIGDQLYVSTSKGALSVWQNR